MSQSQSIVHMSPYVASAIIEHAKRREVAAGYILGNRTSEGMHALDYIPMTHVSELTDVTSPAYAKELAERVEAKRPFSSLKLIGWYSAGSCPDDVTPAHFRQWCEAPANSFASRLAIHIHCSLPEQDNLSISWTAYLMNTEMEPVAQKTALTKEGGRGKTEKHIIRCTRISELSVTISALNHVSANVFLDHVTSLALYGGKKTYERSNVLNLDLIAFDTAKLPAPRQYHQQQQHQLQQQGKEEPLPPRPMEDALINVHEKLQAAIKRAKDIVSGDSNSSADYPHSKSESEKLLTNIETIRMTREAELDQYNVTSREDVSTQRFKDALMIKCTAFMLRREVCQIEYLAKQYQDPQARGNNVNIAGNQGRFKKL